jgi:hypothetical protein
MRIIISKVLVALMLILLFLFGSILVCVLNAQTIPYSGGRIVISSDGNEHDHDDWASTPFALALLAARGLQDKLAVFTFSDHIWGSNFEKKNARQQMLVSALEGKEQFGFINTKFIEAVADFTAATSAITDEINKSAKKDPLTIIAAGPMHVVGTAIDNAKTSKLKYVRLISHSDWNDNHADRPLDWEEHSGWTWSEIEEKYASKGLICDHIMDQNGGDDYYGMHGPMEMFDWIKTSPARNLSHYKSGSWDWLYGRQLTCIKEGYFDPSDAGMVIYLLTGKQKTSPEDARIIMENPLNQKKLEKVNF